MASAPGIGRVERAGVRVGHGLVGVVNLVVAEFPQPILSLFPNARRAGVWAMRALYEAASLHEAQLLVHRLEERGIRTHIRNAQLHGALGELPLTVLPVVCITEPVRWKHALAVLAEFLQALHAPAVPDVACVGCGETNPGNFELCWRCGADLPVS